MFQVCLSALITKMCWVRVLPMKRFCVPSSRKVSVPKSTHYANWIRLFSLFPQRLHHHPGIKAWCCNLCRSLRRSLAAGWRVSSQGRCTWESLLCVSFQQTTVFAHIFWCCIFAMECIGMHLVCLFFLQFSTYYFCICMCLNASVLVTFSSVVACACVTCVCVCLKAAGAGAQRMTACLWRSETQTLWSRLRVSCLPAVTVPLASRSASHPLPFPLKAATQEIKSCFQTKTREERRAQTLQKWVVWKGCDGEVYGSKSSS